MDFTNKAMLERYEQILFCSEEEIQRRWTLAREVMKDKGADALVVLEGSYEGYNHWFMGNRTCECILLKPSGLVIAVIGDKLSDEKEYQRIRPVDYNRMVTQKPVALVHRELCLADSFDARDLLDENGQAPKRIAFIHPECLRYDWYVQMKTVLGEFDMLDMGMALDAVRVIKSEEERFLIRQVNHMNEKLMAAVPSVIRPGRTLKSVTDEMQYLAMRLGSGGHFVHVFCLNCGPQDAPSVDTMERMPYSGL